MLKQKCYRVMPRLKTPQLTPASRGKLQPLSIRPALTCPHSSPLILPTGTCSPATVIYFLHALGVCSSTSHLSAFRQLFAVLRMKKEWEKMWERKRRKASIGVHHHTSCSVPRGSLYWGPSGTPPGGVPDFSTQRTRVKSIYWWVPILHY